MLQIKILSGIIPSTLGEDDEKDEGMKTIWCMEDEEMDRMYENKIDWGNRTALKHLSTLLKVHSKVKLEVGVVDENSCVFELIISDTFYLYRKL